MEKLYTKEQIKDAIWHELKESGYTGDNNDRAYEVIGIVVAGIEKITPTKAQPGPRWVKASERLPTTGLIVWRWLDKTEAYTGYKEKGGFHFGTGGARVDPTYYSEIEWLDEQPAAGREEDAVAFLAWIQKNDYYYSTHGGGYWYEWNEKEQETYLCNTNDELYKLFKKEAK